MDSSVFQKKSNVENFEERPNLVFSCEIVDKASLRVFKKIQSHQQIVFLCLHKANTKLWKMKSGSIEKSIKLVFIKLAIFSFISDFSQI